MPFAPPGGVGLAEQKFPEIAAFLSSLGNAQRERFLDNCEARDSPYIIWLYASAMGYEGGFLPLEGWLEQRYPQLPRRKMLEAEAIQLEADISRLRNPIGDSTDVMGAVDRHRNIASLTKEFRAHLSEIDKMSRVMDRRGLILSGADRLMRVFQDMFAEDEGMNAALEKGYEVFWSQVNEER